MSGAEELALLIPYSLGEGVASKLELALAMRAPEHNQWNIHNTHVVMYSVYSCSICILRMIIFSCVFVYLCICTSVCVFILLLWANRINFER